MYDKIKFLFKNKISLLIKEIWLYPSKSYKFNKAYSQRLHKSPSWNNYDGY